MKIWKWVLLISTVFLGVMSASAVLLESYALAFIGFGVAVPIIYVSKINAQKSGEIVEDELTGKISSESALLTMAIMLPVFAIVSLALIVGSGSFGEWAEYSGFTLSFVTLALGLTYVIISSCRTWRLSRE